jgi:hypothetical protein
LILLVHRAVDADGEVWESTDAGRLLTLIRCLNLLARLEIPRDARRRARDTRRRPTPGETP